MKERRVLVEAKAELSVRRQCALLSVNRSGLSYEPMGPDEEELALMRRIDEMPSSIVAGAQVRPKTARSQETIANLNRAHDEND